MITQRYGDLEIFIRPNFSTPWFRSGRDQICIGNYIYNQQFWPVAYQYGPYTQGPYEHQGVGAVLLRDLSADRSLLRLAERYEPIGYIPSDNAIGGNRIFRPVPPAGYVALSDVVAFSDNTRPTSEVYCVKREHNGRAYVRQGECGELLLEHTGTRLWSVVTPPYPSVDPVERLLLPVGGFTTVTSPGRPAPTPTTWILDLPAVVEPGNGPAIPTLESWERPPAQTRVTDRTVTVPHFMVNDPARTVDWQIHNSPFYRIRRHRQFTLILYRDNRAGTMPQKESQRVTTGVTESVGESFSETTGITVGASVGVEVSASPFGMGVSTSVSASFSTSTEMGYERRRDVSTMVEDSKERGLDIPPRSVGCLWMEQHELEPVRADGSMLSNQASLDFRTDYYVTGEYPGGAGVVPWVADVSGARTHTVLPASNLPPDLSPATDAPQPATVIDADKPDEEQ